MIFTVYKSNGRIDRKLSGGMRELVELNLYEDERVIEGDYSADEYFIENGEVVRKPLRPSPTHDWDYDVKTWVDNEVYRLPDLAFEAINHINHTSSKLRSHYVTPIKDQSVVYTMKRDEALRFLSDNDPDISDYPLIAAEIGITAATAYEVAQVYINMSYQFVSALAMLENVRLTAVVAIENATTREDIENAVNAFNSAVSQFV